jgi:hypothetical protein
MKKILTLTVALGLAVSSYAQGLVSLNSTFIFSTNSSAIGGTSGSTYNVASSYYYALLTINDPSGSTTLPTVTTASDLLSTWFFSGVVGTNATGIRVGQLNSTLATPGVAANNWASGTTNFTIVVGWSANEGNNWTTISNSIATGIWANTTAAGVFGWSAVGYGASTALAPAFTIFGSNPGQISSGFTMYQVAAVPEPSTIALAVLGGASLILFRRRK